LGLLNHKQKLKLFITIRKVRKPLLNYCSNKTHKKFYSTLEAKAV